MRSSLQAQLSRVAGFEACGQSSKATEIFCIHVQEDSRSLCSLLPSPLVRGAGYDILLGTEKKEMGKKPKKLHPLIGMQARQQPQNTFNVQRVKAETARRR